MPWAAFTGAMVGQVMVGAWASDTMMRKEQVFDKPAASVAFHTTVVTPGLNVAVAVVRFVTVPEPPPIHVGWPAGRAQLSVAVGLGYVTVAAQVFGFVPTDWFGGQVIVGDCVSTTVIVKEHWAVLAGIEASEARKTTVCVPGARVAPLAGPLNKLLVAPGQLSVTWAAV